MKNKRLSSHLFFIFLALLGVCLCFGSSLIVSYADQTVLSYQEGKEDQPLIMDGQEIVITNDKEGSISWDEFKDNYTLIKVNDTWIVIVGAPETFSLEEFQRTELEKLISAEQRQEIEKSVLDFGYEEDYNQEDKLKSISLGDYEKYMSLISSPLILYLLVGLIITICVGAWTGVEIAGLSLIVYLIVGVIIDVIPIWCLIVIVLGSAGLIAYKVSKGISGGGGEV